MENIENEFKKHLFIVFSQDHYNPLNIIRSLGEVGIRAISILYGKRQCMIPHCAYISKLHQVSNVEEGYELLLKEYGHEDLKPFVFCSDDTTESYLDLHYEEMIDKFIFYHAGKEGRVTWLQDKSNITRMAKEVGMTIPKEEVLEKGTLPSTLRYPIITKSASSNIIGWKKDVHICNNEDELKSAFASIRSDKLCLQEFIKKKGEFTVEIFSIHDGNDVFMPYLIDYLRCTYDNYGFYMSVKPFVENGLKEQIKHLLKKAKFNGICEAEFMKGEDGRVYFLEVNFRASTWNFALTVGGCNLPYFWAKSMLLGRIPIEEMKLRNEPFRAMVEPADFKRNIKKLGLFKWIKDLRGSECLYYFNRKDPLPYFYYLKDAIFGHKVE